MTNSDLLTAAAIAQLSQHGWKSLDPTWKACLADVLLGNLPKQFVLQVSISICSILAEGKMTKFEYHQDSDRHLLVDLSKEQQMAQTNGNGPPLLQNGQLNQLLSDVKGLEALVNANFGANPILPQTSSLLNASNLQMNQHLLESLPNALQSQMAPPITNVQSTKSTPKRQKVEINQSISHMQQSLNNLNSIMPENGSLQIMNSPKTPDPVCSKNSSIIRPIVSKAKQISPVELAVNEVPNSQVLEKLENAILESTNSQNNGMSDNYTSLIAQLPSLLAENVQAHSGNGMKRAYDDNRRQKIPTLKVEVKQEFNDDGIAFSPGGSIIYQDGKELPPKKAPRCEEFGGPIIYECRFCEHTSRRRNDLEDHERRHQEKLNFGCHLCNYRAKQKFTMKHHMYKVHQTKFDASKMLIFN